MSPSLSGVRGPRLCPVCDVELQACWPFRQDDRHCSLCGQSILRLEVSPAAPDGTVWLYRGAPYGVLVRLVWQRGLEGRPEKRQPLRPTLDFRRCVARFGAHLVTRLDFGLEEIFDPEAPPEVVSARLVPHFHDFERMELPSQGIPGELVLASHAGTEKRAARLLPQLFDPVPECLDPSVTYHDGVWQIQHSETAVVIPVRLAVPVAQWVLGAGGNLETSTATQVTLEGLAAPVLLEPDRPHDVKLRVHGGGWGAGEMKRFSFLLPRTGLPPWALLGAVALVPGGKLQVIGGNPQVVQVRPGRVAPLSFALAATEPVAAAPAPPPQAPPPPPVSAGVTSWDLEVPDEEDHFTLLSVHDAPENGITVVGYTVHQGPREPGAATDPHVVPEGVTWLRVVRPRPDELPWLIPPLGAGGAPDRLDLEVDTTQLDRDRCNGALLKGSVELVDSRHRRWYCDVHATVSRAPRLPSYVAFDWGTTNSCAAYGKTATIGEKPVSISFDEEQKSTPELFPSDMYFEDLSDPHHPVFYLGHDAGRKARAHPECCLRSVKRKFQFLERVFVMDEHGRGHTYATAELAHLVLRKLLALAENTLGQEIHNLGLTFPTKWSARVRHRLEAVTRELTEELQRERKPFRITILPPTIDEANAVAINLITSDHGQEHLPETFYLVAYDFGGGTVDTSVLKVYLPEDASKMRTEYIGLGGRGDFGGDDVTRAVMSCLHQRIGAALQRRPLLDTKTGRPLRLLDLPVRPDGEPLRAGDRAAAHWYGLGRKNWDALWKIAELIKIDLCVETAAAAAPPPAPAPQAPPAVTALSGASLSGAPGDFSLESYVEEEERQLQQAGENHPVTDRLKPRLAEISCRVQLDPGPGDVGATEAERQLDKVLDSLDGDSRNAFFRELRFTLDEACDHPLDDVYETNGGERYTVRQRVDDTVRELEAQCRNHNIKPDIIVLAGGGSRLPLVAERLRHYFQSNQDLLAYNKEKDFLKRRVAHGMASYLALRQLIDLDHQLARSVDVIHHPLVLQRVVIEKRMARQVAQVIVPVGAPLNDPDKAHPFGFAAAQVRGGAGGRRLPLFISDWRRGPLEFGYFDLGGGASAALPHAEGATYEAEVRLHGPKRIEMTVRHAGRAYGPLVLVPTVPDPEAVLQSEDPLAASEGQAGR